MKNMFSLYYLLYGEFSSKFVNKKVNSRQGYLTTNNYGSMPIIDRNIGSGKLSFIR
jgi:hypothetical protein